MLHGASGAEVFAHLMSPMRLGPMQLRNRCVIPGHSMRLSQGEPHVTERWRRYLVERARGGAAWVGIESAPVSSATRSDLSPLALYSDDVLPSLEALARGVHAEGAKISAILWHGGHHIHSSNGLAALAPSAVPSIITGETPRAMAVSDIARVIEQYVKAAVRCAASGLDAVEIQTSSDYLLGSFLSPRLNRRIDDYGGSLENRVRIVREILQAVREAVGPAVVVGVRTSVAHRIPNDPHDYSASDSLAAMQLLDEAGLLDYVSLIEGSHWSMEHIIAPMSSPRVPLAAAAAGFRNGLTVPVIICGRIRTPEEAEALLAAGQADLVGMVRTWIAEPDWANKVASGRRAEVRPCMSCNQGCLGRVSRGLPGTCVINVEAGREALLGSICAAPRPLNVAIAGGGPAGLECARVAAERGHRVVVYERLARLGGQMRLAGEAPGRAEILDVIGWWESELKRLGVGVVLNTEMNASNAPTVDRIVWATGAAPGRSAIWRRRPWLTGGIPGTERLPHGRDVLLGAARVSGTVTVIDEEGGWAALSLAQSLTAMHAVKQLTVITADLRFGEGDTVHTQEVGVRDNILHQGAVLYEGALVGAVEEGVAILVDGRRVGPADSLILSSGTESPVWPEHALIAGDCIAPRGFWSAVNDANVLARHL